MPTVTLDGQWATHPVDGHNFLHNDSWNMVDDNTVTWTQWTKPHTVVQVNCYRQLIHMRVPYKVKFGSKWGAIDHDLDSHLTGTTTKFFCAEEDAHLQL